MELSSILCYVADGAFTRAQEDVLLFRVRRTGFNILLLRLPATVRYFITVCCVSIGVRWTI